MAACDYVIKNRCDEGESLKITSLLKVGMSKAEGIKRNICDRATQHRPSLQILFLGNWVQTNRPFHPVILMAIDSSLHKLTK